MALRSRRKPPSERLIYLAPTGVTQLRMKQEAALKQCLLPPPPHTHNEPGVYQLIRTGWLGSSRDSPLLGLPMLGATSDFTWVLGLRTQDLMLVHQAPYQPSCHHKHAGCRNGRPHCLSSDSQITNEAQSQTLPKKAAAQRSTRV